MPSAHPPLPDVEVVHPRPGAAVVECTGEHDLATASELGALLSSLVAENHLVVVDISEAQFVDSSFLHQLVIADKLARAQGAGFRVQLGSAPIVRRAMEISGILGRIEHVETRDEALAVPGPTTD